MIWLWLATAFGLECREVVNMEAAGVPLGEIVAHMNTAGTPVDRDFISCLTAWDVDENLINAGWRLDAVRESREVPLKAERAVEGASWVEIDLLCGSLVVEGADTDKVVVEGTGAPRSDLVVHESSGGMRVSVEALSLADGPDPAERPKFSRQGSGSGAVRPKPIERPCADLTVSVPHATRVVANSTRADMRVWFVEGPVELISHFGNLHLVGDTPEVVLETTSGRIFSDTGAKHATVKTVSGNVQVSVGSEARVQASSISGPLWIWGGPVQRLDVTSVSGDIRLNAAMMESGNAVLQTHKGQVEARVPSGDVAASSHEGLATGPSRSVRPDGPTQRVKRRPAPDSERYTGLQLLEPATFGLWAKLLPERWWFRSGAVVTRTLASDATGFAMSATSFSGDVMVDATDRFPGATGPIIARIEAVRPRLEACIDQQMKRRPGVSGHAVLTVRVTPEGAVASAEAPATADDPEVVADGAFSACVVRAVDKLSFPEGGAAELRWPVAFHPPVDIEPVEPPAGALTPLVDVRPRPVR